MLAADPRFVEVIGVDVSVRSLEIARLRLDRQRFADDLSGRVKLLHGTLDVPRRAGNFDAAAVVEVIEHLDPARLSAFARGQSLFGSAKPGVVVLTTPNREYNVRFEGLPAGKFRHADHRFEWTRAEFAQWCERVCNTYGYTARIDPLGDTDPVVGRLPSQMAVFTRG